MRVTTPWKAYGPGSAASGAPTDCFSAEDPSIREVTGVDQSRQNLNFAFTRTVGKSLLQSLEMALDPGPTMIRSGSTGWPRVVRSRRRGGAEEAHLASLSAGVEEECPLRFARSLARPSTHSLSEKGFRIKPSGHGSPGDLVAIEVHGPRNRGDSRAPPRSHRPIQVRRTQAS